MTVEQYVLHINTRESQTQRKQIWKYPQQNMLLPKLILSKQNNHMSTDNSTVTFFLITAKAPTSIKPWIKERGNLDANNRIVICEMAVIWMWQQDVKLVVTFILQPLLQWCVYGNIISLDACSHETLSPHKSQKPKRHYDNIATCEIVAGAL